MKMTSKKTRPVNFALPVSILMLAVTTTIAHAHPGHEMSKATASHLATSPYHLIVAGLMLLIGAGLASAIWFSRKRRSKLPVVPRR
jgi:ABC-type transport system involved in cytochrome c biogenesis permease subunit